MFPKVRKVLSRSELEELGARLAEAKQGAPTRPHPRSPDTPPGNVVANAITAPLDAVANVMSSTAGTSAMSRISLMASSWSWSCCMASLIAVFSRRSVSGRLLQVSGFAPGR